MTTKSKPGEKYVDDIVKEWICKWDVRMKSEWIVYFRSVAKWIY